MSISDFALGGIGTVFKQSQNPEMQVFALLSDFITDHRIDRYSLDQSYRTVGEIAPSVIAAIYEQAGASRSFLNA
jgi:hypothetical protein